MFVSDKKPCVTEDDRFIISFNYAGNKKFRKWSCLSRRIA